MVEREVSGLIEDAKVSLQIKVSRGLTGEPDASAQKPIVFSMPVLQLRQAWREKTTVWNVAVSGEPPVWTMFSPVLGERVEAPLFLVASSPEQKDVVCLTRNKVSIVLRLATS